MVLHGSPVMLMAGLEHVSCLMPAILCVSRRLPVVSGPGAEVGAFTARAETCHFTFAQCIEWLRICTLFCAFTHSFLAWVVHCACVLCISGHLSASATQF